MARFCKLTGGFYVNRLRGESFRNAIVIIALFIVCTCIIKVLINKEHQR